jgi:Reverse transcriptase (RNA-dependent DNA polymerase).
MGIHLPLIRSRRLLFRRSQRSTKGTYNSTKYIDEIYLTSLLDTPRSHHDTELTYQAELHTDLDTGDINYYDAHAYVAKLKKSDPDNPTFSEAMSGPDAEFYIEAMQQEVQALMQQRTWQRVARKDVPANRKILRGTWAFKLKRLPDGTPLKYKARYCCRGDMQTEGVDYFDTYAPVVQWSTIRLVLTLALKHGWSTRQVDYTNAFAQAEIQEEVYIEPPRGFAGRDGADKVLKLLKSLYGLKQAPKTFFDKLRAGLLERGFTASEIDPCLFMKDKMICVVYVDDTILCGPNSDELEREIKSLGVNNLETRHTFQLRNEGEIGDFLGIRIEKKGNGQFHLTQTGLIDKVLKATNMELCNPIGTPASKEAIGADRDGEPFAESWKYSTVIGMLLYLSGNTRPDITFAVHQCARFSHDPKQSHAVAIKRILRYLKGTRDKGMILSPNDTLGVDCYVDADFAGLWGVEHDQDPVSVKSRTGYILLFMGCPLLWVSKMQTQIALSTMEAEYIALSSAMRELIAIREVLKEIKSLALKSLEKPTYAMTAKTFEPIPSSSVYEDNDSCLKFATLPKMSPRTKHIAIPYHFFRTKVAKLEIVIKPIDTKTQIADQFTKGLTSEDFTNGRKAVMGW